MNDFRRKRSLEIILCVPFCAATTTWGWVNNDCILIFGWTTSLSILMDRSMRVCVGGVQGGWWQEGGGVQAWDRQGETKPSSPCACPSLPSPPLHQLLPPLLTHQYAAGLTRSTTRPRPLNTLPLLWGEGLRGSVPRNPVDNLGFLLPTDEERSGKKRKQIKE